MPDFTTLYPAHESMMLQSTYDAITTCGLWDWMRTFTPHANEGFLLTAHPNLNRIEEVGTYHGHSGASWAWTMRIMEAIAKQGGWDAYEANLASKWPKDRPVCACRSVQGLKIGWCGVAGFGVPGCEH